MRDRGVPWVGASERSRPDRDHATHRSQPVMAGLDPAICPLTIQRTSTWAGARQGRMVNRDSPMWVDAPHVAGAATG